MMLPDWSYSNDSLIFFQILLVGFCVWVGFSHQPVLAQSSTGEVQQKLNQMNRALDYDVEQPSDEFSGATDQDDQPSDLGRQRLVQYDDHKYFHIRGSASYQYNDNVYLSPDILDQSSDLKYNVNLRLGYAHNLPRPHQATTYADIRHVSHYDENALDVNQLLVGQRYQYSFPTLIGWAGIYAKYEYEDLMYDEDTQSEDTAWDSFQSLHNFSLGFRNRFPITKFQYITADLEAETELTESLENREVGGPDDPEKSSFGVDIYHFYEHSNFLGFLTSYQYAYEYYHHQESVEENSRRDQLHVLSANILLDWTDYFRTRLNANYSLNRSNVDEPEIFSREYDAISGGIQLEFNL